MSGVEYTPSAYLEERSNDDARFVCLCLSEGARLHAQTYPVLNQPQGRVLTPTSEVPRDNHLMTSLLELLSMIAVISAQANVKRNLFLIEQSLRFGTVRCNKTTTPVHFSRKQNTR